MDYAELKRHADELSRLLRVPMNGNENWDRMFVETGNAIAKFFEIGQVEPEPMTDARTNVIDNLPAGGLTGVPEPLKALNDMTRAELMAELGLKSSRKTKAELAEEVMEQRCG